MQVDTWRVYAGSDPCYRIFLQAAVDVVSGLHERDKREAGG